MKTRGFSLIELILVMAMIVILMTMSYRYFRGYHATTVFSDSLAEARVLGIDILKYRVSQGTGCLSKTENYNSSRSKYFRKAVFGETSGNCRVVYTFRNGSPVSSQLRNRTVTLSIHFEERLGIVETCSTTVPTELLHGVCT